MSRIILIITSVSLLFGEDKISDDLAYIMVIERINKKVVPTEYIEKVFNNKNIERHKEILDRFATPYEKKSWEQYKKLFIKNSRIVAGTNFYTENKDLILSVSKKYDVDPFIILSIAGIESNYGKH